MRFFFSLKGFWSQGTFFKDFHKRDVSFLIFKVFFRSFFFQKACFFYNFQSFF